MRHAATVRPGLIACCIPLLFVCLPGVARAGDIDVGVEWINKFPDNSGCDTLYHRDECAERFYDEFTSHGWTGRFCNGNDDAWEEHWKEGSSGGTDSSYVDRCDIALVATHGNSGGFAFNARHDDQTLSYRDAQWGDDTDLEWIVLDACGCLEQGDHVQWHDAYHGLHTICGFDTNAHDKKTRGEKLAEKLFDDYTVVQAWWYASEVTEGSGTFSATMGVYRANNTYGDHIHNHGSVASDSSSPTSFWYHSHDCD